MKLPDTPQPGSSLPPAVWYRQVVDFLRHLAARMAALEARPGASSARVSRSTSPFALTGFVSSGSLKIRIFPGMVNNAVPTISGTSIVAVPRPSLTVTGSAGIIQLKATVDTAGVVTDLIAEAVAGPAVTADTATEKYKLVGAWTASGGAFTSVTSILDANQTLYLCGGTAIWEA